ncbi:MAG: YibE/F family protein [Lachnospiraceae bacterium]|nr:YibE/F family protein [Lachnospiraceae bacterium]
MKKKPVPAKNNAGKTRPDPGGNTLPSPAPEKPSWLRKNWLALVILAVSLTVFVLLLRQANNGRIFRSNRMESEFITTEQARVVNISDEKLADKHRSPDAEEAITGYQTFLLELLTGKHAGEKHEIKKSYVGIYTGPRVQNGDKITVYQELDEQTGEIKELRLYQYDRSSGIFIILAIFLAVVLLVGGRTGAKSLLGLGFTVVALIWIFCPMWMKGADPIPLAFWLCVLVSVMSFVILGGTGKKVLCAVLGTVAGMGLAALFGIIAQKICRINGYSVYESNTAVADLVNLQDQDFPLHIAGLITAGIIISSLGAVMDVAMSLASSISELKAVNPELKVGGLWRSAMNIGRDMVGTMTNTLILAFVGSSLIMVIRLWSQGPSRRLLLSSQYLATEMIPAVASSIGVILAVPLTAVIGALLFGAAPKAERTPAKSPAKNKK